MSITVTSIAEEFASRREALILAVKRQSLSPGRDFCLALSQAADEALVAVLSLAEHENQAEGRLAVVATGGYGRKELSPFSDIDISIIPKRDNDQSLSPLLRFLFKAVNTVFSQGSRMGVGYNLRLTSDLPGLDSKTRSSLMDMRWVAGDPGAVERLESGFWADFPVGPYLVEKLAERELALSRTHATPGVVEPDLKNGAGGLRCAHTANWLHQAVGYRSVSPSESYEIILAARNLLHIVTGSGRDVLTRSKQAEICELVGRELFSWLAEVSEAAHGLHGEYLHALDMLKSGRYPLAQGVFAAGGEIRVENSATLSGAASGISIGMRLGLSPPPTRVACRPIVNGREMVSSLGFSRKIIDSLESTGILSQVLPELAATKHLFPRDSSHQFTVYEHTLRSVEIFGALLEKGGWIGEAAHQIDDPALVVLALLLHDAGKIDPTKPHSEVGAKMARNVCIRWGLSAEQTSFVEWLVLEHLSMAHMTRVRDVSMPETVQDLATLTKNTNGLSSLTLLTQADIMAVSDHAWTPMLESYMQELYYRTLSLVDAEWEGVSVPTDVRRKAMLAAAEEVDPVAFGLYIDSLPGHYLTAIEPEKIRQHFAYVQSARDGTPVITFEENRDSSMTELTVVTPDTPGLLSLILGTLYAHGVNLSGLKAHTTTDPVAIAVDTFSVNHNDQLVPEGLRVHLARSLEQILSGAKTVDTLLREKGIDPTREQTLYRAEVFDGDPLLLEVRAPKGRGMAYRMSRLIAKHGWSIESARVGQWAGDGGAAFYLRGASPESVRDALPQGV